MSLFKTRNVWSTQCGIDETFDSTNILTAEISGNSNQIFVGSHSGYLRMYEPSFEKLDELNNEVDYKPTDLIIETQLPTPILQVAVGRLVSGSQVLYLITLHPRSVAVYGVATKSGAVKHGDQSRLVLMYEHQLARSAYSMVVGSFGRAQGRDFICVQSLDGTLSFYEQEAFAFNWFLPSFLLPGPLTFIAQTDSFVTVSSSWHVESYRYQLLAEAKVLKDQESSSGKKILPDWSYNLGEPAVDVQIVTLSNETVFIMILGERNLFCLLSNGALRFMKRLEYKPFCFHPYLAEPDGRLMTMISTDSNTLLVYEQTTLRWSSQLEFTPVAISRGNFSLPGLLVLLSDIGKLQLCFLGTAPSLFVPPPIDTHSIDYKASAIELAEFQKIIKSYSKSISRVSTNAERDVTITVVIDPQLEPCAFKTNKDDHQRVEANQSQAQMCRVAVELLPHTPLNKVQVAVIVQFPLAVNQVSHSITSLCNANQVISYVYHVDDSCDVSTLEIRVVTSYLTSAGVPRVVHTFAQLPLALVATYASPDREADYKLTINTNQPAISLAQLFPEFVNEGALSSTSTAVGFRYMSQTDCSVSILSAKSSLRYRLQSNNLPSLCLFTDQIINRLKKHFYQNKDFVCTYSSSLPIHELFSVIEAHFVLREKSRNIQNDLDCRGSQFRAIQRRLLAKFKDKTPRLLANLDMLLKDTHAQLVTLADDFEQNQLALSRSGCQLGCIIRLVLMLIKLMNFASEEDYMHLVTALSAPIQDLEAQGWEEVTEAAVSHLLRTVFSKSVNDQQSSKPITLEPMKDTARLKKHISTAIDRLSKASYSNKFKDDGDGTSAANISTIPEAREGSEGNTGDETPPDVPTGSQYGERAVSSRSRARQGPLLPAQKQSPLEGAGGGGAGDQEEEESRHRNAPSVAAAAAAALTEMLNTEAATVL